MCVWCIDLKKSQINNHWGSALGGERGHALTWPTGLNARMADAGNFSGSIFLSSTRKYTSISFFKKIKRSLAFSWKTQLVNRPNEFSKRGLLFVVGGTTTTTTTGERRKISRGVTHTHTQNEDIVLPSPLDCCHTHIYVKEESNISILNVFLFIFRGERWGAERSQRRRQQQRRWR